MKYSAILLLLVSFSLNAQDKKVETPTIVFRAPLAETIVKDGISFRLEEIVEDSRCPSDVVCVWAGKAIVKVLVSSKEGGSGYIEVLLQNGKQPVLFETETSLFRAVKLSPYPISSTKNTLEYVLLISEESHSLEEE
ncbi:MAG: hypothetical protein ACJAX3_002630 [Patiriisocius sp.]|jgi:hypothetical protein